MPSPNNQTSPTALADAAAVDFEAPASRRTNASSDHINGVAAGAPGPPPTAWSAELSHDDSWVPKPDAPPASARTGAEARTGTAPEVGTIPETRSATPTAPPEPPRCEPDTTASATRRTEPAPELAAAGADKAAPAERGIPDRGDRVPGLTPSADPEAAEGPVTELGPVARCGESEARICPQTQVAPSWCS